MSRARPVSGIWFDKKKVGHKASAVQLETLASAENVPLDDLLDEGLSQGQVLERLREATGDGVIPPEVLEHRRIAREAAASEPACRICDAFDWTCEGRSTRHHFVPRWLMLELENYQAYSSRARCTIPVCVGRHRDLHYRSDETTPKSIAQFLNDRERAFAQKMLDDLKEQHPSIFDLILGGSEDSYEYILIRDYTMGRFRETATLAGSAESEVRETEQATA